MNGMSYVTGSTDLSRSYAMAWVKQILLIAGMLMVVLSEGVAGTGLNQESQQDNAKQSMDTAVIHQMQKNNPHWKEGMCDSCHEKKPRGGKLYLRKSDINGLCNTCHEKISSHSYIHPYGMRPSKKIMRKMPGEFKNAVKRGKGKLTCISCHNLHLTCLQENWQSRMTNPLFFRDGPYPNRTEFCYRCHERQSYQRLNPHDQLDKKGNLREKTCTVCHRDTEKLQDAKTINDVDFNYQGDLSAMCAGCHPVKPHPGGSFRFFSSEKGPNHLVVPPEGILLQLHKMQEINQVVLPLEPGSNRVFCGTCHNPHEKGVIKNKAAAKGADSEKRLRMKKICTNCHDK